jgi:hypothetical protein
MSFVENVWSRWSVIKSFGLLLITSAWYGSEISKVSDKFPPIQGAPSRASFSIWGVLYSGLALHVCFGNIKNACKLRAIFDVERSWIKAFSQGDMCRALVSIKVATEFAVNYAALDTHANVHLMHAEWLQVAELLQVAMNGETKKSILLELQSLLKDTKEVSVVYQWALWGILDNWFVDVDISTETTKTFAKFSMAILLKGYAVRGQQSRFTLLSALF